MEARKALQSLICLVLITHIKHVRKENICKKGRSPDIKYASSFIVMADLKRKNTREVFQDFFFLCVRKNNAF